MLVVGEQTCDDAQWLTLQYLTIALSSQCPPWMMVSLMEWSAGVASISGEGRVRAAENVHRRSSPAFNLQVQNQPIASFKLLYENDLLKSYLNL